MIRCEACNKELFTYEMTRALVAWTYPALLCTTCTKHWVLYSIKLKSHKKLLAARAMVSASAGTPVTSLNAVQRRASDLTDATMELIEDYEKWRSKCEEINVGGNG